MCSPVLRAPLLKGGLRDPGCFLSATEDILLGRDVRRPEQAIDICHEAVQVPHISFFRAEGMATRRVAH